ncbi:Similar to 54S ribosomal protein L28, mitochondrial; acc. no. P36527 [Pyronema omphalodes CBS 100304]|uniref:Large ribosomal subunit protein mL40 n=1 Tax=Pyronema omphalodes (strain CBS 100304) TaxID=1076935 RepID=U4LJS3_PYROM|nr:Similar to 54S ribosomal protein L28, mitochondrial; acc. no. P36527 [Pyronema omphalodes CBS 100304]
MNRIASFFTRATARPVVAATPAKQTTTLVRSYAKKVVQQGDPRVRMIRYFLNHPAEHTPRPLKFGTLRALRHWTIHRAWQLFRKQQREAREKELERQYNKMRDAVEALKTVDERLYRIAISKKEVGTFPIELRIPTDTPPRNGWNAGWKRS